MGAVRGNVFDTSEVSAKGISAPSHLPSQALCIAGIPELRDAPRIAIRLRRYWGVEETAPLNVDRLCERLGIEVTQLSLGAADGGPQGFLIPKRNGGFRIEVDPEPRCGWDRVSPAARSVLSHHRKRFLVCHELAHTIFYEEGLGGPQRVVSGGERQEAFCDELARSLLIPHSAAEAMPLNPGSVLTLQHRYDVSMEIALRSTISAHRGSVGWLLLQRGGETRIQWSSAELSLTAKALGTLRRLGTRAAEAGRARAQLSGAYGSLEAKFLKNRDQVIVTAGALAAA